MSLPSRAIPSRRLILKGAAAAAGTLSCPAVLRGAEPLRLRLGHGLSTTHPVHPAMEAFAEMVRERSSGAVQIAIFPDGQLGQELAMLAQLKAGRLDLVKASASVLERASPAYRLFNLPFLFRDRAHWLSVAESPVGDAILASGAPDGMVGLTFYEAGSRSFYGQRPIEHPRDLKGLKIRIQPSPTMQRLLETFEAVPVQMPWEVVYSALHERLVDGAENSVIALIVGRHGEVVRYYSFDEHTTVPDVLVIGSQRWEGLSPAHRQIMREAAAFSFRHMNTLWAEFEATARGRIEAMGVTFTFPDKQPFVERTLSMRNDFADDRSVADLIARIVAS